MSNLKLQFNPDTGLLKQGISQAFGELLRSLSGPVLLMLAGGSSRDWLGYVDEGLFNERVTIAVFDERFSQDPEVNNFLKLKQTDFYRRAAKRSARFIDTSVSADQTLASAGKAFESALQNWANENPLGTIVATIGVGSDGHIASLMPYPEAPEKFISRFSGSENNWVISYDAEDKNKYSLRLTPTIYFLKNLVDYGMVYVVGKDKLGALECLVTKEGSLAKTPARLLLEMKNVTLFTDQKIKNPN